MSKKTKRRFGIQEFFIGLWTAFGIIKLMNQELVWFAICVGLIILNFNLWWYNE